jgi:hypothetical protein
MFSAPPHPTSKVAAINDAKNPFFVALILTSPINGKNYRIAVAVRFKPQT